MDHHSWGNEKTHYYSNNNMQIPEKPKNREKGEEKRKNGMEQKKKEVNKKEMVTSIDDFLVEKMA